MTVNSKLNSFVAVMVALGCGMYYVEVLIHC